MAGTATSDESQAQLRKEYEGKIDSLKRRLKEAEFDKKKLRDEERKIAEDNFKKEITEKSAELTEKTNKVRELNHTTSELSGQIAQAKKTNSELAKRIARDVTMKDVQSQIKDNGNKFDVMLDVLKLQLKNDLDHLVQADTGGLKRENEALASSNAELSAQLKCANDKIEDLRRDLKTKTEVVAGLKEKAQAKKKRKKECVEEERKRMAGLNDSHVKDLMNNFSEILTKKEVEMEQLRAVHDAEIEKMKGELADEQRAHAVDQANREKEKQCLANEYFSLKTEFNELHKRQQDDTVKQKDEEIRRMKGELANYKAQIVELTLALNKETERILKLTEEHDVELMQAKEKFEKEINSLKKDLATKDEQIRRFKFKVSLHEKSAKTRP